MSTDKLFDDLTNVGKNALHDYDDLLHKYNRLVKDHEVIKGELDKLQNVAEPMFSEYGQMRTKYEMEVSLRSAAEVYANKVLNDNKKIKRQSAMIIAQMSTAQPVAVDIDIDDSSGTQDDRIEELGKTITKLQDEVARTKAELFEARDEINILHTQLDEVTMEREEYKMQCLVTEKELSSSTQAIKKHQRELKAINRASTLAVVDYSSLNDMYETEKALRIKAESYAGELQRKRTSLLESKQTPETESEAIIQLKEENDKLHTELTEQEMKYKVEMEGLEQQLKDSASHGTIENLEEKLDLVKDDIERLNDELDTQKKENEELRCKIVKMEKEKAAALNIPLPPPPPPPPGPAAGIGRLIFSKKKKKEQKLERVVGPDAVKDQTMKNALEEMMKRIKSGKVTLIPVDMNTRPDDMQPKDDSDGTLNQMHQCLQSINRKRQAHSPVPSADKPNQLQQILARRRERSNSIDVLDPSTKNKQDRESKRRSNSFSDKSETAKGIAEFQQKQGSFSESTKPCPKPRKSIKVKQNNDISNELASKLNAARYNAEPQE